MKVSVLKESLRRVYQELGYSTEYSVKEIAITTRTLLSDLDRDSQNQVIAAFIGFAIGKAIGFQEGINHIFEYTPEEQ